MASLKSILSNPFSFLFATRGAEEQVAVYLVREHKRGRSLTDIVDDPYVRNRCTERDLARVLERPEIIQAFGDDIVAEQVQALDGAAG
ncbi:MAG TPA: hypothetical protein VHS03_13705 [Gaiellaceae bacterium]|nr:hypothetical protein [Gaiellaceae bacterium]